MDTKQQGCEDCDFDPQDFDGAHIDKPMDDGDAIGAPTRKRYNRELAYRAWLHIETHNPEHALPDWVAAYLKKVAKSIIADLGPKGGLSPSSAHAALGLVGQQWPVHHPDKVFMIIDAWRQKEPELGRKAGAVRYIEEFMGDDRNANPNTVVEWYRQGQKTAKRD